MTTHWARSLPRFTTMGFDVVSLAMVPMKAGIYIPRSKPRRFKRSQRRARK